MQHLVVKGLGRRAVAEALAGERPPQAADGVLHAPFCQGERVSQKKVWIPRAWRRWVSGSFPGSPAMRRRLVRM